MGQEEKLQIGRVVSAKMDKTVVVRIDRHKRHRLYRKTIRVTRRYKAHDETNACNLGDVVRIAETRPLSRDKRWRVVEIVTKGDVAEVAPTEIGSHIIEDIGAAQAAQNEARIAAETAARMRTVADAGREQDAEASATSDETTGSAPANDDAAEETES